MAPRPSPNTYDGVRWEDQTDDDMRREYVEYIINTPEEHRTELDPDDVADALDWADRN